MKYSKYRSVNINEVINDIKNGIMIRDVAAKYNVSTWTIRQWLKKEGVTKQTLSFNHNYFETLNKRNSYWLGFIFADGCCHIDKKGGHMFSINVALQDREHLEKFHKDLDSNHKVGVYSNGPGREKYARSQHVSEKLVKDLIKLGCTPRKTFTIKFPNISNDLIPHFVRGLFDGDGCAYWNAYRVNHKGEDRQIRKTPTLMMDFCGTEELLTKLKEILGISNTIVPVKGCYRLQMCGQKVFDIVDWMYKDADIFLERKFDKIYKGYTEIVPDTSPFKQNI